MGFLFRYSKRLFTYKYGKYIIPHKFMRFRESSIKPESLNIDIEENIIYFRTYFALKDENLFFRYILFYELKSNSELFEICEILFMLSREKSKQKLVYQTFRNLLNINLKSIKEKDIIKLEKILSKNLFQKSYFSDIIKDISLKLNNNI